MLGCKVMTWFPINYNGLVALFNSMRLLLVSSPATSPHLSTATSRRSPSSFSFTVVAVVFYQICRRRPSPSIKSYPRSDDADLMMATEVRSDGEEEAE
ncbi:uncharacterized protein G2W53_028743 [Senna tora]|uniref:Uncharacterized protein n=1 Tax=Senna tora TaxID=362788 RepID=A0A834WF27_9FABA|nr:uncharacterized protein G2W53_028743 [Senna tora]